MTPKSGLVAAAVPLLLWQQPTFRTAVDAVTVEVTVRRGATVANDLAAAQFALFDNGVRQQIVDASKEHLPLEIVLLLDRSGSVDRRFVAARSRIEATSLKAPDLIAPDDAVRVRWFGGAAHTSLYDVVAEALMEPRNEARRRAVVVLSDGLDTQSTLTPSVVMQVADRAAISVFVVVIATRSEFDLSNSFGMDGSNPPPNVRELRDLAERTGGRFESVTPDDDFSARLVDRLNELRHRYVLRYFPSDKRPGWHNLKVEVTGGRHTVRHRRGYWR